jgi:hypothetical protein
VDGETCTINTLTYISTSGVVDFGDRNIVIGVNGAVTIRAGVEATVRMGDLTVEAAGSFEESPGEIRGESADSQLDLWVDGSVLFNGNVQFSHISGGGSVWISATESITVNSFSFTASGTGPDGPGGSIDLTAGEDIQIKCFLKAYGGENSHGGTIILSSGTDLVLQGDIDLSGGSEGSGVLGMSGARSVQMTSSEFDGEEMGANNVNLKSTLDSCGDGGSIWIHDSQGVEINSLISASGLCEEGSASGGSFVVERASSITWGGSFDAMGTDGGDGEGAGGRVWIDASENLLLDADLNLSSSGDASEPGSLDTVSLGATTITGLVTANGALYGGMVSIVSGSILILDSAISARATSEGGTGGDILLASVESEMLIAQSLNVTGEDGIGGSVTLYACDIITVEEGTVDALDTSGSVSITGIDGMMIQGPINAGSSGNVTLTTLEEDPVVVATLTPDPEILTNASLVSCSISGRDGTDLDGDGHAPIILRGGDCDDLDASVYPGATEVLDDGVDNDCDGLVDESSAPEDTGEAETDTGPLHEDTGTPPGEDIDGAKDTGGADKGCTCSTGAAPAGVMLLIGLLPWIRRR